MSVSPSPGASPIPLTVWDTAGQERYAALVPYYSHGADALVFVYDVTDDISFDNLEMWIGIVEGTNAAVPGFVVGNKIDALDEQTQAAREIAFATEKGFGYTRTSAHTGMGITDLFMQIAAELAKRANLESDLPFIIDERPTSGATQTCGCR
jgi:small GTP-binding protein